MSEVLQQELGLPGELISRLQEKAAQDEDLNLLIQSILSSPAQKLRDQLESLLCNNDQVMHDLVSNCEKAEDKFQHSQKELLSSRNALKKLRKEYLKIQNDKITTTMRDEMDNSEKLTEFTESISPPTSSYIVEKEKLQATLRESQVTIFKLRQESSDEKFRNQKAADDVANLELEKQLLQKQVVLLKSQCDDTCEKLASKSFELAKCKADKASQTAELKANLNQLQTENQVLKRTTELYLAQREELIQKLSQSQESCNKVEQKLVNQEQRFQNELDSQTRLKTYYQEMSESLEKQVRLLENEIASLTLEHHRYVAQVETIEIQTKTAIENLQGEMKQLIEENNKLLALPYEDDVSDQADSPQNLAQLQLELLRTKRDNRNMQQNLKELVVNIKLKQPILEEQKCQYDFLVEKNKELTTRLAQCEAEKDTALFESRETQAEIYQLNSSKNTLNQQINRLSRQVQVLLSQQEKQTSPYGSEAHLTPFRDIQELHKKNIELQAIVDELVVRFEAEESRLKTRIDELHASLDGDVQTLVESSNTQTQEMKQRIQALEADLSICDRIIRSASVNSKKQGSDISPEQRLLVSRLEHEVAVLKQSAEEARRLTSSKIESLHADVSSKGVRIAQLDAAVSLLEDQLRMREDALQLQMHDADENRLRLAELEGQLAGFTRKDGELSCMLEKEKVLREQSSQCAHLASQELQDFKALAVNWKDERSYLVLQVAELSAEVNRLQASLQDSESRHISAQDRQQKSTQSIEAERDEALSRLNTCLQSQDSQVARHERFVVSAEERLLRLKKESEAKVDALQSELKHSRGENKQLHHQIEELQTKLVGLQNQARSLPAQEQSVAPEDNLDLKRQLEERMIEYQTVREALEELSSAYAQYRAQTSSQLAKEKENCNQLLALQQELNAQIDSLTKQVSTSQKEYESFKLSFTREKSSHEREIKRLQSTILELENAHRIHEDETASLKAIAEHSTSSYEDELVGHADKIRMISLLKDEINGLKAQLTNLQPKPSAQDFTVTANQITRALAQLSEANTRIQDLELLNLALKNQFEATGAGSAVDPGVETRQLIKQCTDDTLIKMQSLSNANKLLQLDISSLTTELNKTRQELEMVRAKCHNLHHEELEDAALQNKFLHESNCFLRGERDQLVGKLANVEEQLENSLGQVLPFRDEVHSLRSDLGAKDAEIDLLRKENEQWTARLQSMLQGQRIDPREYDAVKAESLSLQLKLDEAQKTIAELEERNTSVNGDLTELKNKYVTINRLGMSFKRRFEQSEAEKASMSSAPLEKFNKLQEEHNELRSKYQEITSMLEAKSQQLGKLQNEYSDLRSKHQELSTALEDKSQKLAALQASLEVPEDQLVSSAATLNKKLQSAAASFKKYKSAFIESKAELEKCRTDLEDLKKDHLATVKTLEESSATSLAQLEMLHKAKISKPLREVALLKEEIANLKATYQLFSPKRTLSPSSNLQPDVPPIPLKKARSEGADPVDPTAHISVKEEPKYETIAGGLNNESPDTAIARVSEQDYDFLLNADEDEVEDSE